MNKNLNRIHCPKGHVYDARHIERYGYYCPYKHVEYHWPPRKDTQVSTVISDSICKFIRFMHTCGVQAFPGATIQRLTTKVQLGYVNLHHMKNIIVHVGTNNIEQSSVQDIIVNFERLINAIQQKNPVAKIFISSILPRPKDGEDIQRKLVLVNAEIRTLCKHRGIYNLKSYKAFGDRNSSEFSSYFAKDKLHLSRKGTSKLTSYFEGNLLKYKN